MSKDYDLQHLFSNSVHNIVRYGRMFSTAVCSHIAKQLWREDEPVCNAHSKSAPQIQKRRDRTLHVDDICVFVPVPAAMMT